MRSGTLLTVSTLDEQATKLFMPVGDAQFEVDPDRAIKRQFQVQTNTSLVNVTGTRFRLKAVVKKIGQAAKTGLITLAGKVNVAPVALPDLQVEVGAGEASQLEEGKAPTPPVSVPPEVQNSLAEGGGDDAFDTITFPPAPDVEAAVAGQETGGADPAGAETDAPAVAGPEIELNLDEVLDKVSSAVDAAAEDAAAAAGASATITIDVTEPDETSTTN